MKIKFSSDEDLPPKKTLELYYTMIDFRPVFYVSNKHYLKVFLEKCLYK